MEELYKIAKTSYVTFTPRMPSIELNAKVEKVSVQNIERWWSKVWYVSDTVKYQQTPKHLHDGQGDVLRTIAWDSLKETDKETS